MKYYFFPALFIQLLFLVPLFAGDGLTKLTDDFYKGEGQDGLFFYMERIDAGVKNNKDRLDFWKRYVSDERNTQHMEYKKFWADRNGNLPKGFLLFQSRDESLDSGFYSLEISLKRFSQDNELWIGFASIYEFKSADEIKDDGIEMAVSIMTNADAPMVEHIGINKSFSYLLSALAEKNNVTKKYPLHKDLSMRLHSFAAKVMKQRDDNKIYMITAPVPAMREIMLKALKGPPAIFVGDRESNKDEYEMKAYMSYIKSLPDEEIGSLTGLKDLVGKINGNDKDISEDSVEMNKLDKADYKIVLISNKIYYLKKDNKKLLEDIKIVFRDTDHESKVEKLLEDITKMGTPIIMKNNDIELNIKILDKKRKNVIFEIQKDWKKRTIDYVITNGKTFEGDKGCAGFKWFLHPDMSMNPFITIDYETLAEYLKLKL